MHGLLNYYVADTFVTNAHTSRHDLFAQPELTQFSRRLAGLQLATPSLKWEIGGLERLLSSVVTTVLVVLP